MILNYTHTIELVLNLLIQINTESLILAIKSIIICLFLQSHYTVRFTIYITYDNINGIVIFR